MDPDLKSTADVPSGVTVASVGDDRTGWHLHQYRYWYRYGVEKYLRVRHGAERRRLAAQHRRDD